MIATGGKPMDTMKYRELLGTLDRQIEEAKKEAEEKGRLEDLDRRIKLCQHWIDGLATRKAELAKYGVAVSSVDIDGEIRKIEEEKKALEEQFRGPAAVGIQAMAPPDHEELGRIIEEASNTVLDDMSFEERWSLYGIWACRWRILAVRVGQAVVDRERTFGKAFGIIRDRMKNEPYRGPFISALDPRAEDDWLERLTTYEEMLKKASEIRAEKEKAQDAQEATLFELGAVTQKYHLPEDPEGMRLLKHHVRQAARYEHLREEVADMAAKYRSHLEPEFAFLWKKAEAEAEEPEIARKLTNREIAARLLRKMKSKGLIGASHGPYDMLPKGFPAHDVGRAKETLDVLIRAGILKAKPTVIGQRVSIEPKMLGAVDDFQKGKPFGMHAADAWCETG
jgi:hypothetical protein